MKSQDRAKDAAPGTRSHWHLGPFDAEVLTRPEHSPGAVHSEMELGERSAPSLLFVSCSAVSHSEEPVSFSLLNCE